MDPSAADYTVFGLVVAARLLVPLLIPWYPLPGVVAALVLDAVDQTLFQSFTRLPLDGYQSYDKALDVYYLSIAYISTLRNWTNHFAFSVARFLFYYRLVGVALFELPEWRLLLFVFPNTFEYFFIWYEAVVLWRDPRPLRRATIAGAAAAIWILIKLPQEFWLHIARLDLTDVLKTALFRAPPETTWGHLFAALPGVFVGAVVGAVGLLLLLARLAGRRLPKYMMLRGSRTALFNADLLVGARGAVVVEGEFDAMLLGQFLPDGWAAVTMGGAGAAARRPLPGPRAVVARVQRACA